MTTKGQELFGAIFAPETIALIGASSDPTKNTSRPQRMLRAHGYTGTIIPVNPKRDVVFGEQAYPSLLDAPGRIDHAFIMVPADAVPKAVEDCLERDVTVATIYTDGFAEIGAEGRQKQDALVTRAREAGLRLLGPNCSGVYSSRPSCALSVNAAIEKLDITPGSLAVISQSGSMTGGLVSRGLGRGVGFSRVVSIGNEADLGIGELVDLLVDDDQTDAILLFVESIRDAPRLAHAAHRALTAGKLVVAYTLGRSDVGRDLAASHTGAMVGSYDAVDSFLRVNGILRVDNLETLFELPALLSGQRPSKRHRVAVMTTTGGGAAMVVDRLGVAGVDVVAPTPEVIARLSAKGVEISDARLTDLTHAGTRTETYSAVLNELLASDHCDLVVAIGGSSAQFQPEIAVQPVINADRRGKPLAMFIAPDAPESLHLLNAGGAAGFRTPESCVDAIRAWRDWTAPEDVPPARLAELNEIHRLLETGDSRATLNERDSSKVLAALGIPFASSNVIQLPDEPVDIEFPVVAKVLSGCIAHKSDAGGVVLDISDQASLRVAARSILERINARHPNAVVDGILVQQMHDGLAEVILGYRRDPQVGPVVVLGIGGVTTEIYRDIAISTAPIALSGALRMIDEVRGLKVLSGFRGRPRGDIPALADAIVAMSQLAYLEGSEEVAEAEINPLLVLPEAEGVIGVDALIVLSGGN